MGITAISSTTEYKTTKKGSKESNTQSALMVGRNCMICVWQRKACSLRKRCMATVSNEKFVKSDRW